MTEKDTIKFEEHTIVSYIWSNMAILFKDLIPPIKDKILKNQERVADLEKRIERLMVLVSNLHDVSPENESVAEIIKYFNTFFEDFEATKK